MARYRELMEELTPNYLRDGIWFPRCLLASIYGILFRDASGKPNLWLLIRRYGREQSSQV